MSRSARSIEHTEQFMEHEIVWSLFALACYLYMSAWSISKFCCLCTSYYCMYLQFVLVS